MIGKMFSHGLIGLTSLVLCGFALAEGKSSLDESAQWGQFRGHRASGVAKGKPAPAKWDAKTGENVKWKTPIPGLGHSSPIVWGDRVFVTTAVRQAGEADLRVGLYGDIAPVNDDSRHSWRVIALDAESGKILWDREAHEGLPKVKRHTKATHANSTPATDGKHVVALFGSEGLYCFDYDGNLLWKQDLGVLDAGYWMVPDAQWEFGSSPIIHKNLVIVQADVQKGSFIAAFDLKDGKRVWKQDRSDVPTWGSPTIFEAGGRVEVVANGYREIAGYDAMAGDRLWHMGGGADIPVPTPIVARDMVILASSHSAPQPIYAIKAGASGDISLPPGQTESAHIAWSKSGMAPYMQTPIVVGDLLFACKDNGILAAFDLKTGERKYAMRLGGGSTGFTASPVASDGRLYFTSEEGDVYMLSASAEKKEPLAVNPMGEVCMATPAIVDGRFYIRGQKHLFAIGE